MEASPRPHRLAKRLPVQARHEHVRELWREREVLNAARACACGEETQEGEPLLSADEAGSQRVTRHTHLRLITLAVAV